MDFYVSAGALLNYRLEKDVTADEFDKYRAMVDSWINESAIWIGANMGVAARERFLDRADMTLIHFPKAVNERHSAVLSNLDRFRPIS